MAQTKMIELTAAQEAMLVAFTDQRCVNFVNAADFVADLSDDAKDFLEQAEPATLKFLKKLSEEEVKGLQTYLALRTTGSYLAWGFGALVAGFIAVSTAWNALSGFLKK